MSSALSVSSTGVASDQTCTCHRSRWSTPRRFSEVSRHCEQVAGARCRRPAPCGDGRRHPWSPAPPRPRHDRRRAADRRAPPTRRRRIVAVSRRVPPASQNATSWSRASCSSVSRPQVMVPRPSRDTVRPVSPTRRAFMAARYPAGRSALYQARRVGSGTPRRPRTEDLEGPPHGSPTSFERRPSSESSRDSPSSSPSPAPATSRSSQSGSASTSHPRTSPASRP